MIRQLDIKLALAVQLLGSPVLFVIYLYSLADTDLDCRNE